jgi:putative Mg2+ transporter-C (MgtC) family protein
MGSGWPLVTDWPGAADVAQIVVRLVLASVLGGLLGYERERRGKAAGLRTHMLVALGAALFVLVALDAGAAPADLTRVIQGIATGIGFVGAGAILKLTEQGQTQVRGLTTAASVWLTAAMGTAVGAGRLWLPVFGTILALVILAALRGYEARLGGAENPQEPD